MPARTILASTLLLGLLAIACTSKHESTSSGPEPDAQPEPEPPALAPQPEPELVPEPMPKPEPEFVPEFVLAPTPSRSPSQLVSHRGKGCSVQATLDPSVVVLYGSIDVYAVLAGELNLEPSLPERAKHPLCDACTPDAPNPIVLSDAADGPIDGFALGFVIPIGSGQWVLPLGSHYREYHCMPAAEVESLAADRARITIRHMHAEEQPCEEAEEAEEGEGCGVGCFYAGATQFDLLYDAETTRALLLTRDYDALDDADQPKPTIALTDTPGLVQLSGCGVDESITWPPTR